MDRTATIMLRTAIAVLALLNAALFWQSRRDQGPPARVDLEAQRWAALPPAERLEHVQRYQMLVRRADGHTLLDQAREFAALPADEQQRLRTLRDLLVSVVDRQSPADRRELLRLSPRARAYFVYRAMLADMPSWLSRLSALRGSPAAKVDRPPATDGNRPASAGPANPWEPR
jgi:hypothetical protein